MKYFYKNVIAVSTGVLLASACMSGCAGAQADKAAEPQIITVWNYYNGSQKEQFDQLVGRFNETEGKEAGIIVEAVSKETINQLTEELAESLDRKVGAAPLPDLCTAYADMAYELEREGLLADMSPYLTQEEALAYVEEYLAEGQFQQDGSVKVFPTAKSTELLTVNLTAWEAFADETGIPEAELSTWEGLARAAERYYDYTDALTPEPDDGQAFFGRDAFANYLLVGSSQLGHELIARRDGETVLDFDRDTMRRLWDAYYVPFVRGYYTAGGKFRSDDLKTGRLIAYVGSTSGAMYTPQKVVYEDGSSEPIRCGIFPLPDFEGTEDCAVSQGAGMVMIAGEKEKEQAAMTFLKWFTGRDINLEFCLGSGYLPVRKDANDPQYVQGFLAENQLEIPEIVKETLFAGMEQVRDSRLYTMPPVEGGTEVRALLNDTMERYAAEDREALKARTASGMSAGEAAAMLDTEARFEQWYLETEVGLKKLVSTGGV